MSNGGDSVQYQAHSTMPRWYAQEPGARRITRKAPGVPGWFWPGVIVAVVGIWALTAEMVANSWMLMEASKQVPEHGYKITVAGNQVPWFAD